MPCYGPRKLSKSYVSDSSPDLPRWHQKYTNHHKSHSSPKYIFTAQHRVTLRAQTSVVAGHVLYAAKVPLHPHANAVVLVGQLQSYVGVVVEGLYLSWHPGVVLHAALLGPVDATARYLPYPHPPRTVEAAARGNEWQGHRVRGTSAHVYVH